MSCARLIAARVAVADSNPSVQGKALCSPDRSGDAGEHVCALASGVFHPFEHGAC